MLAKRLAKTCSRLKIFVKPHFDKWPKGSLFYLTDNAKWIRNTLGPGIELLEKNKKP